MVLRLPGMTIPQCRHNFFTAPVASCRTRIVMMMMMMLSATSLVWKKPPRKWLDQRERVNSCWVFSGGSYRKYLNRGIIMHTLGKLAQSGRPNRNLLKLVKDSVVVMKINFGTRFFLFFDSLTWMIFTVDSQAYVECWVFCSWLIWLLMHRCSTGLVYLPTFTIIYPPKPPKM